MSEMILVDKDGLTNLMLAFKRATVDPDDAAKNATIMARTNPINAGDVLSILKEAAMAYHDTERGSWYECPLCGEEANAFSKNPRINHKSDCALDIMIKKLEGKQ